MYNKFKKLNLKFNFLIQIAHNIPEELQNNSRIIIATFLIQNGANLNFKNKDQMSPLNFVNELKFKHFLQKQFFVFQ